MAADTAERAASDSTEHNDREKSASPITTKTNTAGTNMSTKKSPNAVVAILLRVKAFLGINVATYKLIFKGALAPTIATAIFQANGVAETYTTTGYIISIMAILSVVIAPRAKFLQTTLINVLFSCASAAVQLLAMYCSIKARQHTTSATSSGSGTSGEAAGGAQTAAYNSSASAVSAIWLFFNVYVLSVIRGKNVAYTIPCIMGAIFANVGAVYGCQFAEMAQAESFVQHLLQSFLTGIGIATAVSLLIFPMTSRHVVFDGLKSYLKALSEALEANQAYMQSLQTADMFSIRQNTEDRLRAAINPEAEKLKQIMQKLTGLHAKVATDVPFAKREIAVGMLGPDDIQSFFAQLPFVLIPMIGLSRMPDIFSLISAERGWQHTDQDSIDDENEKLKDEVIDEWHELMRLLREPFAKITKTIQEGLQHVAIVMRFEALPKHADEESDVADPRPGTPGFTTTYTSRMHEFLQSKELMLRGWCRIHGIELPDDFFKDPDHTDFEVPQWMQEGSLSSTHRRLRRQLFMCLYMEFLLYNIARATLKLINLAEGFKTKGKFSKRRLIVPGYKRMRKWLVSLYRPDDDVHADDSLNTDGSQSTVHLGQAYRPKKDPEHLPPVTWWERSSDEMRAIPHFFRSSASVFGFRVAIGTMAVAIVAFLEYSQVFFTTQRLFWAQIMVAISMSPTAGQSLANFLLRILGTVVAVVLSWIAWYIVDGQTAGVLVFLFIILQFGPWALIRYPQYRPVGMISQVTMVLCIGYELQTRKLGIAEATSNGQSYQPIYLLASIRLATVCAGLFIAWIFTIFPFPISEHNEMRRNFSSALYLLANYHAVMHETVRMRLKADGSAWHSNDEPAQKLDKARRQLFTKANLAINSLRAQRNNLVYDIPVGGRFPQEQYEYLIDELQKLLDHMALVSIASLSFTELHEQKNRGHGLEWIANLRKLTGDAGVTSQQITSIISLLSSSILNAQPLPPYVRVPEPFSLSQKLDASDRNILSVRHIAEPGYASFAVIQIGTRCIIDDVKRLVVGVRELVGEMDFSYRFVESTNPSSAVSKETLVYRRDDLERVGTMKQD